MISPKFEFLILLCSIVGFVVAKNNVCKNWSDYWFGDKDKNENCMYNPDMYLDVPQLLEKYFGSYEVHEITTDDGYFLTIFRIPRKNFRGTILFIHPSFSDSIYWVGTGKESLAYYFWKNGYEIWLSNTRGTDFSTKHMNLTINDFDYWNFSFHETAIYDLRASLKYVYNTGNNTRPAVIGHSTGSTESLVYSSLFSEEAARLSKIFILLAPTSSFRTSVNKLYLLVIPLIEEFSQAKEIGSFGRSNSSVAHIIHYVCQRNPGVCIWLMSLTVGFSRDGTDPLIAPILLTHSPRGVSIKTLLHFLQLFAYGKFSMYDYKDKNFQMYGSSTPPEYPVSKILAPIYFVYGTEDKLALFKDIENIYENLPQSAKIYGKLKVVGMNHIDEYTAIHRKELVYDPILLLLNKIFSDYVGILFATPCII